MTKTQARMTRKKPTEDMFGCVDPVSATYLQGAVMDFEEHPFNSQFVMRNPRATTTCGCGKSFTA